MGWRDASGRRPRRASMLLLLLALFWSGQLEAAAVDPSTMMRSRDCSCVFALSAANNSDVTLEFALPVLLEASTRRLHDGSLAALCKLTSKPSAPLLAPCEMVSHVRSFSRLAPNDDPDRVLMQTGMLHTCIWQHNGRKTYLSWAKSISNVQLKS